MGTEQPGEANALTTVFLFLARGTKRVWPAAAPLLRQRSKLFVVRVHKPMLLVVHKPFWQPKMR